MAEPFYSKNNVEKFQRCDIFVLWFTFYNFNTETRDYL